MELWCWRVRVDMRMAWRAGRAGGTHRMRAVFLVVRECTLPLCLYDFMQVLNVKNAPVFEICSLRK